MKKNVGCVIRHFSNKSIAVLQRQADHPLTFLTSTTCFSNSTPSSW